MEGDKGLFVNIFECILEFLKKNTVLCNLFLESE